MKFNWDLLYKIIMAIVSVLLGANQLAQHQEHEIIKAVLNQVIIEQTQQIPM